MFDDVAKFEEKLNLPERFYEKLLGEDDWSFLIKISALIEAACTHALSRKLGFPLLEDSLAYLDQANTKVGRIALLRKVDVIYDNQAAALRHLAELRNAVAHDIKNVEFTFKSYVSSLDKAQKAKLVKNFGHSLQDSVVFAGKTYARDELVLNVTKLAVWTSVAEILACLYLEVDFAEYKLSSGIIGSVRI